MSCRIKNIIPPCAYNVDGIISIKALDLDDLKGLRFTEDGLYNSCLVTDILRSDDFIDIYTSDLAKYSSTLENGVYTHLIETFINQLSSEIISTLHLATKRRYLMLFKTKAERYFCFGYETGATISYSNQTTDGSGSLVNISASSTHPLFEVCEKTLSENWVLESGEWEDVNIWTKNGIWKTK